MVDPFPFAAYLRDHLGIPESISISIESLSGGLTNHTVRAVFWPPTSVPGSSVLHQSLILKHAPPYIASLGPEHMLSTRRQTIEARSLSAFDANNATDPPNLATLLLRHPKIRIPKLLYHDEQKCILIMSDLGRIPVLTEYLAGFPDSFGVASTLAEFLSDLHQSTRDLPDSFFYPFINDDSSNVIQKLVGSLPRKLLRSANVPDADALGESVEQSFINETQEPCFGMVDLWPGSVLVGNDYVGLVDWEYAGKSAAGEELGMLTAHLRFQLLSPGIPIPLSTTISKFIREFLSAYATHFPVRSSIFINQALVAHGRELINSVEFQSAELAGEGHKGALIQAGARCIRAATLGSRKDREEVLSEQEQVLLYELI